GPGSRPPGGEGRRIPLARALLMQPRVLILDDALSHVDVDTEAAILAGLDEALGSASVLLVANRPARPPPWRQSGPGWTRPWAAPPCSWWPTGRPACAWPSGWCCWSGAGWSPRAATRSWPPASPPTGPCSPTPAAASTAWSRRRRREGPIPRPLAKSAGRPGAGRPRRHL